MEKIYKKGYRKEYYLIKKLREEGCYDIIQRTAGSNSPIDIIAINIDEKTIRLIQSKRDLSQSMSYINPELKAKIEKKHIALNGFFLTTFEVL